MLRVTFMYECYVVFNQIILRKNSWIRHLLGLHVTLMKTDDRLTTRLNFLGPLALVREDSAARACTVLWSLAGGMPCPTLSWSLAFVASDDAAVDCQKNRMGARHLDKSTFHAEFFLCLLFREPARGGFPVAVDFWEENEMSTWIGAVDIAWWGHNVWSKNRCRWTRQVRWQMAGSMDIG